MHIGEWLRDARQDAGMALEEATFRLRGVVPQPYWVSVSTMHRLEAKSDPDPVVVLALAEIYSAELATLPPEFVDQARKLMDLFNRMAVNQIDSARSVAAA